MPAGKADAAFTQATDSLIALYRNAERRTLDLPVVSVMPILMFFWAVLRFEFFLLIGIILIIPTNVVILILNLFPGHWEYRPFFLYHIHYVLLWIWRGEAPTAPFIFIRPLFRIFLKRHFTSRLRRLRQEIILHNELSETTRSALLRRVDGALERWKTARFSTALYTFVVPAIISLPNWTEELTEFTDWLGIPTAGNVIGVLLPETLPTGVVVVLGVSIVGYVMAIPVTAFLAKRGFFIGRESSRICFPGGQGGVGIYAEERTILRDVGLRMRETPFDLWIIGIVSTAGTLMQILTWEDYVAWAYGTDTLNQSQFAAGQHYKSGLIVSMAVFIGLIVIAAYRRRKIGRN